MTLRDAIREMLRWCQVHRSGWCLGWKKRETFRWDIQAASIRIRSEEVTSDSIRERQAAFMVYECALEEPEEWRSATRWVWATL